MKKQHKSSKIIRIQPSSCKACIMEFCPKHCPFNRQPNRQPNRQLDAQGVRPDGKGKISL